MPAPADRDDSPTPLIGEVDPYATRPPDPVGTPKGDNTPPPAEAPAPEAAEFAEVIGTGQPAPAHPGNGDAAPAPAGQGTDDTEGARLIALNMALNGTPREEPARYLSENFQRADAGGLLDEVYASVEG